MLSNQIIIYDLKMKTYQQLWQSITTLYEAGEAQAIVRTVLDVKYGMTLTDIICGKVNELSADEERKLEEIIRRLQKGEPVQYVLGKADFAGRTFHVEPGVLIPRPETAELCEWIEKDVTENKGITEGEKEENTIRILDICTGSGCIAITLGLDIGEGYHVRCGEGHAEVNAFASVKPEDEHLLSQATIYVSLEPCSHYGKTPPCADLIVRKGVKRCVCGCVDPFAKVQGRGIRKIREAGIEVTVGVLEAECLELNKRFITFNTHQRPYIILKWAQTANGFLDNGGRGMAISSPFTKMLSHKLRAENDAILIGRVTDERDHSQLNVRDWSGKDPMRLVIDRHHPCFEGLDFSRGKTEVLQQIMQYLYNNKVQSLIVEGGAITHQAFLDAGLWDEIRVETLLSTSVENSVTSGTPAPMLPHNIRLISHEVYDGNVINTYERQ